MSIRPHSKRKGIPASYLAHPGQAVVKVVVPSINYEKTKEYNQLYEEAFEQSEKLFEEKMGGNYRSKL
jgi:hypothetical protein